MDLSDHNLEDSALVLSVVQKRKASASLNSKDIKQLKSNVSQTLSARNDITNCSKKELNFIESKSSYFNENKCINICFLCLKKFENESGYLCHMKLCAKRRQMSTKQLLNVLELQKKHMDERRALGLCTVVPKNKRHNKNFKLDCDLALGIALSKSLKTQSKSSKETPVSTLEDFGFSSNTTNSKKKNLRYKKLVLKERTENDRKRIITEKAAAVLLTEEEDISKGIKNLKQDVLKQIPTEVPHLWNLCQSEGKSKWYVDNLKDKLFLPDKERNTKGKKEIVIVDEGTPNGEVKMLNKKQLENQDKDPQKRVFTSTPNFRKMMQSEMIKLESPKDKIYQDWKKIINNEKFSDINGRTKDCQNFYLHSLVLLVRCPQILNYDFQSILSKYNLSTLLFFFEYLYCGAIKVLPKEEIRPLINLAINFSYDELINILTSKEINISEKSESFISSSWTPKEKEPTNSEITIGQEDADIFLDKLDNEESPKKIFHEDENKLGNLPCSGKLCWSFSQYKEIQEVETIEVEKKDNENSGGTKAEINVKTVLNMKQSLNEAKKDESATLEIKNKVSRIKSNDSATEELDEEVFGGKNLANDILVISSDTDTRDSKTSQNEKISLPCNPEYEIPYYDSNENYNALSPLQTDDNLLSQSFITGDVSFIMRTPEEKKDETVTPDFCSTPLATRQKTMFFSNGKNEHRKRKGSLSTNRIVRKSLGIKNKSLTNSKNSVKKNKKSIRDIKLTEGITACVVEQLSNSALLNSLSPLQSEKFVEMTPLASKKIEFGESVTPSPNYSKMGESLLKDQLSKYGLKKSLAKGKAKKILRFIYDELHPLFNVETGKLVKILPGNENTRKLKPKTKSKKRVRREISVKKSENDYLPSHSSFRKNSDTTSERSDFSFQSSKSYDSNKSEFDELNEPLTQSLPSNPIDLPSALKEFFDKNPNYHQKVLLYEPIWLEELQKSLKEVFSKSFKLSDLMDYLDQQCITFRTTSQKRNNQIKNERKRRKF